MRGAAEKAVTLDPASSEAWAELATTKWNERLGNLLDATGRLEGGWKEFEVAQELDPHINHLSGPFYRRGDYDRAIELEQTLGNPDGDAFHHYSLSQYYALKGMYKEWIDELGETAIVMGFPEIARRIRQAFSQASNRACSSGATGRARCLIRRRWR